MKDVVSMFRKYWGGGVSFSAKCALVRSAEMYQSNSLELHNFAFSKGGGVGGSQDVTFPSASM